MTAQIPENFLRHGAAGDLPRRRPLVAGPLTLDYENGDLRYLRLGDREIVRRIYVAVRDRNWGTVPVVLTPVRTEVRADSFDLVYDVVARQDEIDFRWRATITGTARGEVSFELDGAARSTFLRNRIGFCVLHPPTECRGARCRVRFVDGRGIESAFPAAIAPDNPFTDMAGIDHEVTPRVWCRMDFEGDAFEMEDQRNWGDASFKTFCTPLRRPFPVAIEAGTIVRQAVRVRIEGEVAVGEAAHPRSSDAVTIELRAAPRTRLPAIGVAAASHGQAPTARELARLRDLRPAHLRVELRVAGSGVDGLEALRAAAALGAPLEIALFLTGDGVADLRSVAQAMEKVRPAVARWLVFHADELAAADARWVELARNHLARFGAAAFVTGTDFWFVNLNRCRPPRAGIDGVCFTLNPQVHASDHASLVETLTMHAELIASARTFTGDRPLVVSPVTLKMRGNPAATGPERQPGPGELPARVDPRQLSLFGAGWTLGSVKYLAESGVASATYYETTGWLGVMETEAGSPAPELFPSIPGAVFPLYHVLADLNEFAGAEVIACASARPLEVEALLLAQRARRRVLLANLSAEVRCVTLPRALTGGERGTIRRLHAASALEALTAPERFRRAGVETRAATADAWRLDLEPFEFACLDVVPSPAPSSSPSSIQATARTP